MTEAEAMRIAREIVESYFLNPILRSKRMTPEADRLVADIARALVKAT